METATRQNTGHPGGDTGFRDVVILPLMGLVLAMGGCATTQFPLVALGPDLRGRIHAPEEPGPHPAVLLLHGSGGIREEYHEEAAFLADHGYIVLVLDYYEDVGLGGFSGSERRRRWRHWQDEVVQAVRYLRARSDVSPHRVALVGYSQGAALAVSSAHLVPDLRAIVDFFGPDPEGWYVGRVLGNRDLLPDDYLDRMPPVLILHGSADPIVPVSDSRRLNERLTELGRSVELHIYTGSLHSFHSPISGTDEAEQVAGDARERMLHFLDDHTGGSGK